MVYTHSAVPGLVRLDSELLLITKLDLLVNLSPTFQRPHYLTTNGINALSLAHGWNSIPVLTQAAPKSMGGSGGMVRTHREKTSPFA